VVIKILKDSEISNKDTERLTQFVTKCFGDDNPEDRKTLYFSPTFKHLLLFENKKLISYLRTVKRKTRFKGKNILIGGIGAVSTLPEYRNKGYATNLLKKAVKILKEEGADMGLLQTNPRKGVKLYNRAGFILANKSYKFRDVYGKTLKTRAGGVMIAPLKSPYIMNDILASEEILHIGDGDW
jgi:predicted acetyltransferase